MTTKITLKPLGFRLIARAIEEPDKTPGGLLLAPNAKEKPQSAKVLAVGPEVEDVAPGDTVIYVKYSPETIKHEGEDLLVLSVDDCLAVVG